MRVKGNILVILILLLTVISLGVKLRLIDGTEARINIYQLTEKEAVVQAEGFSETIKLDADEIEYILFDESNPSLLDSGGIVLTNGSVLYPKKFKIDVNEAVIETDSGIITCSLKEIASISYLFLNWFGEENVKGKITSTELTKDEKIKMRCLENSYLVFSKLEIQGNLCIGTDGKIRGVINLNRIYWISFPEVYGENYPVYVELSDGSFGYAKILETTTEGLILETMTKERVNLLMNDVEIIDFEGYRKVRSINLNLSEIKVDQNNKINMILGKQKLGGFSFTLQRSGNQLVMSNQSKSVPYISRIVIKPVPYLIKWTFKTDGDIWLTSPAVDKNGAIYITDTKGYLYAINPDGTLKWKRLVGSWNASSPSIGRDGTIYVSSHDRKLYAIDPDGRIIWTYTGTFDMHSSPSIAPDGTLYFGDSRGKFYAVDQNGKLRWTFQTEHEIWAAPAIAPDGTIYFLNFEGFLYALSKDGTLKWKAKIYEMNFFQANYGPAIGSDGTVYIGSFDGNLYAFDNKGNLKWKVNTSVWIISPPVVGPDDTIYFGTGSGEVLAVSPSGKVKWKVQVGNSPIFSSAVVGNNRTIYTLTQEGILCAIDESGAIKWRIQLAIRDVKTCLGYDGKGTLYVAGSPNLLYSISITASSLANSSWPKFKINPQNTGLFGEK